MWPARLHLDCGAHSKLKQLDSWAEGEREGDDHVLFLPHQGEHVRYMQLSHSRAN